MQRLCRLSENRTRSFLDSAGSLILTLVCTCCVPGGIPKHAQLQGKNDAAAVAISAVYEVVSIKPAAANTDPNSGGTEELADGYKATNVTLLTLIRRAYGIGIRNQISGGPSWLGSDAFDIQAKMDGSVADSLKKLRPSERKLAKQQMLQALLADRFKLIVHRENRELPVYMLVVAKNGPKLHESKLEETRPNETYDSSLELGRAGGKLTGRRMTSRQLAGLLTSALSRTVLDKTGLVGSYDVTLQWTADQAEVPMLTAPDSGQRVAENISAPDPSWPFIFTAIHEQLGLKLEEGKGPVEIIVIDRAEKPSGN